MVNRWTIRTKLRIALASLSCIVMILALCGFWGLTQYRTLASSISKHAADFPRANDLDRIALTMLDSHHRWQALSTRQGMIEPLTASLGEPILMAPLQASLQSADGQSEELDPAPSLLDIARWEQRRFKSALLSFDIKLQLCSDAVADQRSSASPLIDVETQRKTLEKIRELFDDLVKFRRRPDEMATVYHQGVERRLDQLVESTNEHISVLHGGMSDFSSHVRHRLRWWIGTALVSFTASLVMVAFLLWAFRTQVARPFGTLVDGAREVSGGNYTHQIQLDTGDELSELAEAMNLMARAFDANYSKMRSAASELDRQVRQKTREVIRNEQLASVGFLAAGVSHEINNPLAAIAWSAESMQSRLDDLHYDHSDDDQVELLGDIKTSLQRIEEEAFRVKGITDGLRDFSRLGEVRRKTTNVALLARDVVAIIGKVGKYRCKTIRVDAPESVEAHVNAAEIRQVLLNLIVNALESVAEDGRVDVRVVSGRANAVIVVQDNGCGMTEEVLEHLFEPFFTRRRDGTGSGLGLSITYRIVSQHGGSLTPTSDGDGLGTRMEVSLPIDAAKEDCTTCHGMTLQSDRTDTRSTVNFAVPQAA